MKKRDDEWLSTKLDGDFINNHFAWFHVIEHQSSHLGQIYLLKNRMPPKEELVKIKPEKVEKDY